MAHKGKKKVLVQEDIQRYVASGGVHCPWCGSQNIQGGDIEMNEGYMWQRVDCLHCGRFWDDEYALIGIFQDGAK